MHVLVNNMMLSFNYTGAVAWNDLPGDIKSVRAKPMFKSTVE